MCNVRALAHHPSKDILSTLHHQLPPLGTPRRASGGMRRRYGNRDITLNCSTSSPTAGHEVGGLPSSWTAPTRGFVPCRCMSTSRAGRVRVVCPWCSPATDLLMCSFSSVRTIHHQS